jgi:EAL domain-containing protein (putative c-di-GMP-specific phosphodiesterase class I)
VSNGVVSHVELLLRMISPDGTIVEPGAFLPLAERSGLIREIDCWVVNEAVRLLAAEQEAGRFTRIEVNLSGASLGDPVVLDTIATAVASSGVDRSGLVLEITETAAIADLDLDLDLDLGFAAKLAALSCRFALERRRHRLRPGLRGRPARARRRRTQSIALTSRESEAVPASRQR